MGSSFENPGNKLSIIKNNVTVLKLTFSNYLFLLSLEYLVTTGLLTISIVFPFSECHVARIR